jgi:prophage regulatory protein
MKTCRLLRLPEVMEITGLRRDTIYRHIREGRFPRQRRISQRASGWREDEVRAWVDSRPTVEPPKPKESSLQTWLRSPSLL